MKLVILHHIKRDFPLSVAVVGSEETYLAVRAALVARGTTLNAWCKANSLNRQTVEKALRGLRHSKNGTAIRERLVSELFTSEVA